MTNPIPNDSNNNDSDNDDILQLLQNRLFRFDCYPIDELSDYHLGLLDDSYSKQIKEHIETCILCQEEIDDLVKYLEMENVTSPTATLDDTALFTLAFHESAAQPPALAIRGEDDLGLQELLFKTADGLQELTLLIGRRDTELHYVVHGQFILTENNFDLLENASVEIWVGSDLIAATLIDEMGAFICQITQDTPFFLRVSVEGKPLLYGRIAFE